MRTNTLFFVSLLMLCVIQASAQSIKIVEGTVIDSLSGEQLSFATVVNQTTSKATITNEEGYFKLEVNSLSDTLVISYVGYQTYRFKPIQDSEFLLIKLKPAVVDLKMVTILPKDYGFLYKILEKCKEKRSKEKKSARVYYQLKSYIHDQQIELIEAFYNATLIGYDLLDLKLKAGRVGLRKYQQSFFGSLESSKPINQHKIFFSSNLFPISPLEFSAKKMKKKFYLNLEKTYLDDSSDSIYVVFLYPKKKKGDHFNCKAWINASDTTLLKVELHGVKLDVFPFDPIYPGDRLSDRSLRMTKTFTEVSGKRYFEHIDFKYEFNYHKKDGSTYPVKTEAVLFTYDNENPFLLPQYGFKVDGLTDYQKLGAIPYNSFFWDFNDELKMNEELESNQAFMNDPTTVTNYNFRQKQSSLRQLFSYSAYQWSPKRIAFKELPQQTKYKEGQPPYKLRGGIFLDYNQYRDSSHLLTASMFDAYQSYFLFYISATVNCFINLHFDLIESERRDFLRQISQNKLSEDYIQEQYEALVRRLKSKLKYFEDKVERGRNKPEFEKWNDKVSKAIMINNLSIFGLEETEE